MLAARVSGHLMGRSPPGHVVIRPGAQRDGHFTNNDKLAQLIVAIIVDILRRNGPRDDQFFIFDDALTHLKRADAAIFARKTPLNIPNQTRTCW